MYEQHTMSRQPSTGEDTLLVCDDGCGRRIVFKTTRELVVIDRGDFFALHSFSSAPVEMSIEVTL